MRQTKGFETNCRRRRVSDVLKQHFFGDNNADCLCGMEQLHGNQNVSSDETIKDKVREISKKRCRKSQPKFP